MAEQKKRGFHALEERIHQMEQEDTKAPREATDSTQERKGTREQPAERRPPDRER